MSLAAATAANGGRAKGEASSSLPPHPPPPSPSSMLDDGYYLQVFRWWKLKLKKGTHDLTLIHGYSSVEEVLSN